MDGPGLVDADEEADEDEDEDANDARPSSGGVLMFTGASAWNGWTNCGAWRRKSCWLVKASAAARRYKGKKKAKRSDIDS